MTGDSLTSLLAEALERLDQDGERGLDRFLAGHPDHADQLRSRLQLLHGAGMIGIEAGTISAIPERLGEFRLLRRLGSGGMGVVYLAEQPSLGRRVALKLIRPEHLYFPKTRERFHREIAAAARLEHPRIVRVYSAGEEEGVPYFTMEHVAGVSLADLLIGLQAYAPQELGSREVERLLSGLRRGVTHGDCAGAASRCDATGAGGEVEARDRAGRRHWVESCFRWTLDLAEALEAAHSQGVLHRDLKPSNVMLTWDRQVKLLDFGLASTREGSKITRSGSPLGSLPYMAPEQVRGEPADERTDVYALGVTLYELLTLRAAFHDETQTDELTRRRVLEGSPLPIGQLNPAVPWDAETVCTTAMDPDPERRYPSAAAFAADLRNVLELRPIAARRPGPALRLRRLAQRHPAWTVGAVLGFLLVVVAPTLLLVREHSARLRIERAEAAAKDQADVQLETLRFLNEDLLQAIAPNRVGRDASMREVLDVASARIEGRFPDRPRVEASIRETLGNTYRLLGVPEEAERHLRRAVELFTELDGASRALVVARNKLGQLCRMNGRTDEAEQLYRSTLGTARRLLGERDPDTLALMNNLGLLLCYGARFEEAEALLKEVVAVRLETLGEEHRNTLTSMSNLGVLYTQWERPGLAEKWTARELALCRRVLGEDHADTLVSLGNWANVLGLSGRNREAAEAAAEIHELTRAKFGAAHPQTVTHGINRASHLANGQRLEEAREVLEAAIEGGAPLGEQHLVILRARVLLATVLRWAGEPGPALEVIETAFDECMVQLGETHSDTLEAAHEYAELLRGQRLFAEAADLLAEVMEALEADEQDEGRLVAELRLSYATCLRHLGDLEEACAQLELARAAIHAVSKTHPVIGMIAREAREAGITLDVREVGE